MRKVLELMQNSGQLVLVLRKDTFLMNFFSLNFSSLINKILTFLLFLTMIRIVTPDQYGIYTLVWAHVGILSPFVDLGTTSYGIIYLEGKEKQTITSLFSLRLLLSLLIFALTQVLAMTFHFNVYVRVAIFLTSFVIFYNMASGTYLILTSIRQKVYNSALISTIFNLLLIPTYIAALFFTHDLFNIFLITFIFYFLFTFVYTTILRSEEKGITYVYDPKSWIRIVKKSYIFVLIGFFSALYFKVDVFLLNFLKGEADVGVYSAGYKFFEALLFIGAGYNFSATPMLAKILKEKPHLISAKIKKDALTLVLVGCGVVAVAIFASYFILPFVLKQNYFEALKVLRIVIWALPLILISSIFANILYILDRAKLVLGIFIFQLMLNGALNYMFIPHFSYISSAYITVFCEGINAALFYVFAARALKKI